MTERTMSWGVAAVLATALSAVIFFSVTNSRASSGVAETSGPGSRTNAEYVGELIDQRRGTIKLEVERRRSGRREVGIDFRGLDFLCEFGMRRTKGGLLAEEVTAGRSFAAFFAVGPADSQTDVEFSLAEGRLLPNGRARGYLFSYFDPTDPPGGSSNQNECWSDGKVRWKAHKVVDRERPRPQPAPLAIRPRSAAPPMAGGGLRPATGERYEGALSGAPEGANSVSLAVERGSHGKRISFQTEFSLLCDGPSRVETVGPVEARLDSSGRFRRSIFRETRQPRHRVFTWVRGEFLPGGRAKGVVAYIDDPWDPVGTTNEAECGAGPYLTWKAKRVPNAR